MQACLSTTLPADDLLAGAVKAYAAAFGPAPYHEGPERAEAFGTRVHQYAEQREGMRLATVTADEGTVEATGLAVLASPGDWWRDHVASTALDEGAVERWLGARCLEVVHVAVRPRARRTGLGRLVLDLLTAGAPAPTGVLACHPTYDAPYRLYASRGWQLVGRLPVPDGEPYRVMARDL